MHAIKLHGFPWQIDSCELALAMRRRLHPAEQLPISGRILRWVLAAVLLFMGCAHTAEPIAWISYHGVVVHGSPGEWLTPQMAADMEMEFMARHPEIEFDMRRCMYGLEIHMVDALPSGAGARFDPRHPRMAILARKGVTAKQRNELHTRSYDWILEQVWRHCL